MEYAAPKATVAVIGAGPAGLMAAEAAAQAGCSVAIYDQMPSPARKFLMAGKSGLNITRADDQFADVYACPPLNPMIAALGPLQVRDWMDGLGQASFVGSTGRVFPDVMKASPLLRAWLARLDELGVTLHRRARWTGWRWSWRRSGSTPLLLSPRRTSASASTGHRTWTAISVRR